MNRSATDHIAHRGGPQTLEAFEGAWRLSRRIADRLVGQSGHAEGRVVFSRDGAALQYDETVTMHLPGRPPMHGTRRYLWRRARDGIAVTFDDGRPFHAFGLDEPKPEAEHRCGEDRYAVRYDFADWPVWCVVWEVAGPRKDYRMETLFVRATPGGAT